MAQAAMDSPAAVASAVPHNSAFKFLNIISTPVTAFTTVAGVSCHAQGKV
jgi:hypothetical protein